MVFGELPATGKRVLVRLIAKQRRATYLCIDGIDGIEQAIRASGALAGDAGPTGHLLAYALAVTTLALRQNVADSVNPLAITRDAWRRAAADASSPCTEIEVVCSDPAEHCHRVETHRADIPGVQLPCWKAVHRHDYEPWNRRWLVLDTAGRSVTDTLAALAGRIADAVCGLRA